jgi:uncharacterized protein (DUF58 family)
MLPSRRTYGLLLLGMAIAAPVAMWDEQTRIAASLLMLLGFNAIVLGLVIWDGSRVRSCRVQVKRELMPRLSIGRDNLVNLVVEAGKQPAEVQIYDAYPLDFGVSMMPLAATLSSNTSQEIAYSVYPSRRGVYSWGDIQVRQLSPWKLTWHDWKISQAQSVAVYPDLIGLRSLSIRLTLQSSGSIRTARRLGTGTEFAELREYGVGDDPRFIVSWSQSKNKR